VALGDFNGDGNLDIAATNFDFIEGGDSVSILLGNGDGTFQAQKEYTIGFSPYEIAVGDFNGDGNLDLAVVCGPPCSAGYVRVRETITVHPTEAYTGS